MEKNINFTKVPFMCKSLYKANERFCEVKDKVSRTVQDAIVDIPTLLRQFGGRLDDLFNKYNNGLLYESELGTGIFIDELNKDEVAKYNKFMADKAQRDAEEKREAELFAQFKADVAQRALEARKEPPVQTSTKEPVTPPNS